MTRKRWLAVAVVAAWALTLVGLGVLSAARGPETVRAHSDLAAGRAALDAAVATLRDEAGPDVGVEVGSYEVTTGCRITMARRGTEVDQLVALRVRPGEEAVVLARLVRRAPEHWIASYHPNSGRFSADAGDFVGITGEVVEPGLVHLTVSTGCRPGTDPDLPQR